MILSNHKVWTRWPEAHFANVSSHYLNQCWNILNWSFGNKLQWNLNQNLHIFIQENLFENVIWEMTAILSWPQWVNSQSYCLSVCWLFFFFGTYCHTLMMKPVCRDCCLGPVGVGLRKCVFCQNIVLTLGQISLVNFDIEVTCGILPLPLCAEELLCGNNFLQLSAIIMWSYRTWFLIGYDNDCGKICIKSYIDTRHPIAQLDP